MCTFVNCDTCIYTHETIITIKITHFHQFQNCSAADHNLSFSPSSSLCDHWATLVPADLKLYVNRLTDCVLFFYDFFNLYDNFEHHLCWGVYQWFSLVYSRKYSLEWIHHSLFICSPIGGLLNCFSLALLQINLI